jgi:mono/diheme cytochrome c family protein
MTRAISRRTVAVGALMLLTLGCARGCSSSRPPIHIVPDMDDQPRYEAQAASDFFYDGMTMRTPVPGTVPRSDTPIELQTDRAYNTGKIDDETFAETIPVAVNEATIARGEDRYGIYCAPCHDERGSGRGILFERGGVPTTSLHDDRIVNAPDGQIFDAITNGVGLMPGYAWPIGVADRWAIVAWVRELQSRARE